MKTVFIVYTIPDYIGIEVLAVFEKESDAIDFCNRERSSYSEIDYYEQEVL